MHPTSTTSVLPKNEGLIYGPRHTVDLSDPILGSPSRESLGGTHRTLCPPF